MDKACLQGLYELIHDKTFRNYPVWQHVDGESWLYHHPREDRWSIKHTGNRYLGGYMFKESLFDEGYLMSPKRSCGQTPTRVFGPWSRVPTPGAWAEQDTSIRVERVAAPRRLGNFPNLLKVASQSPQCSGLYETVTGQTGHGGYPVWRKDRDGQMFLFCVRVPADMRRREARRIMQADVPVDCLWCISPRIMEEWSFQLADARLCRIADVEPHLPGRGQWWAWISSGAHGGFGSQLGRHEIEPGVRVVADAELQWLSTPPEEAAAVQQLAEQMAAADMPDDGVKVSAFQYMTPEYAHARLNQESGKPLPPPPPELDPTPPDPREPYRRRISHGNWFGIQAWNRKNVGRTSQQIIDDMREVHEAQMAQIAAEMPQPGYEYNYREHRGSWKATFDGVWRRSSLIFRKEDPAPMGKSKSDGQLTDARKKKAPAKPSRARAKSDSEADGSSSNKDRKEKKAKDEQKAKDEKKAKDANTSNDEKDKKQKIETKEEKKDKKDKKDKKGSKDKKDKKEKKDGRERKDKKEKTQEKKESGKKADSSRLPTPESSSGEDGESQAKEPGAHRAHSLAGTWTDASSSTAQLDNSSMVSAASTAPSRARVVPGRSFGFSPKPRAETE